jgi:hypothetical protein
MALLLNTDIQKQLALHIKGHVARIGGNVNQLLSYKHCTVQDINILDGGYGIVQQKGSLNNFKQMTRSYIKHAKQELNFLLKGHSIPRDKKTIILDIHNAHKNSSLENKFDCSISSNVIEHSPNPILLLLNIYYITKKGGYQYHAIPHYKYTFDMHRNPTDIDHLIHDFENMTGMDDSTHFADYIQSAIIKHGWQKEFHNKYPINYPYIHFHVFDEINTRQLMQLMFTDVVNDICKTDDFSDNVVLFRNTLNDKFKRKYKNIINTCLGINV